MSKKYQIIDLSLSIETTNQEFIPPKIKFVNHKKGANLLGLGGMISKKSYLKTFFNFLLYFLGVKKVSYKDFPDEIGLAWEELKLSTHIGTHLDAPWHFGPYSKGKHSKTIDQIPLDWCFADGVVLDLRNKNPGDIITLEDLQMTLRKINYTIKENDIVLIMTGVSKYLDRKEYLTAHPGVSREVILYLLEQGVKIIGTDGWGLDRAFGSMVGDYLKTKDKKCLWPAHIVGREKEYCHIEKLVNLDKIPIPFGFKVACFPIKIKDASAGWIRAVAVIED